MALIKTEKTHITVGKRTDTVPLPAYAPALTSRISPMNEDQIKGSIKDVAGIAQEKFGRLVGSRQQQVKGIELQCKGRAQINFGCEAALVDATRYDEETAKRRARWVNSRG
jgi:uncharacterized protein YjbJ (UPF0337 family)